MEEHVVDAGSDVVVNPVADAAQTKLFVRNGVAGLRHHLR